MPVPGPVRAVAPGGRVLREIWRAVVPPPGPRRWFSAAFLLIVGWLVGPPLFDIAFPGPGARHGTGAALLGGRMYIVGGSGFRAADPLEVESLDPTSGEWRREPALTTPRSFHGVAAAAGKVYAFGGLHRENPFLGSMEVLDPRGGGWQSGPSMPRPVNRVTSLSHDGRVYVVGGMAEAIRGNEVTTMVFDPALDAWDSLPPMSVPRHGAMAAFVGDVLYVIGGYGGGPTDPPGPLGHVEAFDPATGAWSDRAPLEVPRGFAGAAELGGRIYVFGGRVRETRVITEVYDPSADSWAEVSPMPEWRDRFATVVFDGRAYVLGGETRGGMGNASTVLVYDPTVDEWTSIGPGLSRFRLGG